MTFRPSEGVVQRWEGRESKRRVGRMMGNEIRVMRERRKAETPRKAVGEGLCRVDLWEMRWFPGGDLWL